MRRAWLLIVCAGGLVTGCGHDHNSRAYPPDPLLLSHRPVAGKVVAGAPPTPATDLAWREPPAPEFLAAQAANKPWPPVPTVPVSRPNGESNP